MKQYNFFKYTNLLCVFCSFYLSTIHLLPSPVPTTLYEMESLKELDLRAVKKNVCKITPECMDAFKSRKVMVRGGVVKKIKADLKPPPGMGGQHSNEGGEEAHAA